MTKPLQAIPIADIRHFTLHDGPGLRTTIFVKGCPLHCRWCHNPECISALPQLLFHEKLCIGCNRCLDACPVHALRQDAAHRLHIERSLCDDCGRCVQTCLPGALTLCGKELKTVDEVLAEILRDRCFYSNGGGVTASGGEPLLYPEFIAELFARLHRESIHTALDTSGAVSFEAFRKVLPATDLVLFDIKGMSPHAHAVNTGSENGLIHANLRELGRLGIPVEIRMPIVPGCNDSPEELEAAGRFLATIPSILRVRLLAWHESREKYRAAGMQEKLPPGLTPPGIADMLAMKEALARGFQGEIVVPE